MTPTLGKIVIYRVSQRDADDMNKRRADFRIHFRSDGYADTGYVAHIGNVLAAGQEYPAIVVSIWSEQCVNLQVFLDGTDTLWATSRAEGTDDGTWHWPVMTPSSKAIDDTMRTLQSGSA